VITPRPLSAQQQPHPVPPCAICGYDLGATVASGLSRCPECGWAFTDNDLRLLGPSDQEGRPRSVRPGEWRVGGGILLTGFIVVAAFVVIVLVIARVLSG
jgi:hypothetical protein